MARLLAARKLVTTPIIVQAVRFGFLVLLWLFVFMAFRVIRSDVWGANRTNVATPATKAPTLSKPPRKRHRGTARLLVTAGSLTGTTIELTDRPITIGRAPDSTLVLTDDYASSRHARLTPRDGEWYVEDLGSTNGTYLGQAKVTNPMPVTGTAPIRIGKTVIELRS